MRKLLLVLLSTGLLLPMVAFAQKRLPRECRQEIRQLCGQSNGRRAKIECLRKKSGQLSQHCHSELKARIGAKRKGRQKRSIGKQSAFNASEYSYGTHEKQKLDFFGVENSRNAPLIVFVHGGGWSLGDKKGRNENKSAFYNGLGYAFASLNYRLVPETKPDGQAADIADAIAYLRKDSTKLGFDPNHIVLMGHSAGAHLAAIVSTDTSYLEKANVPLSSIAGTILLDGAGYDVEKQMKQPGTKRFLKRMFVAAFSNNKTTQRRLSPVNHVSTPNGSNWLILHVASRADAKEQSELLGNKLQQNRAKVTVTAIPNSSHRSINKDAGTSGSAVGNEITAFLKRVL